MFSTSQMKLHNKGIIAMLIGVIALSVMDAFVKWLVMNDVDVMVILAIRGWMILFVFIFYLIAKRNSQGVFHTIKTSRPKLHIIRAIIGFFAPFLFFTSLKTIPLAEATAIFFCTTFFMTAGSIPILKEHVGIPRWVAIVVGFIGVLVITRPGTEVFQPASLLPLAAGAAYAFLILSGRLLSRTDSTFTLVFYFNLSYTVIATSLLPFFWQTPSFAFIGLIVLVSMLALAGHIALTTAFSLSPVAIIAPYEYTALIWSILLGYLIWGDIPTNYSWFGIIIIVLSGLFIIWREQSGTKIM